jgi:tetratricopeptide (TPR) repeat protein
LDIFVPLLKGRNDAPDYTLFSQPHILDLINQHLLLSSTALVLLLSLIITFRKKIRFSEPLVVFFIIVTICQLLYHFSLDPKLGAVRDWDLLSGMALGYSLLGFYLLLNLVIDRKYVAMVLIFTALLSTVPWFLLNANTGSSIERMNYILNLDIKRSRAGRYTLANYFEGHNKLEELEGVTRQIYRLFPEDSLLKVAQNLMQQGNQDEAIKFLHRIINMKPNQKVEFVAYNELGRIYLDQRKTDQAIEIFQRLIRSNPHDHALHTNLGYAFLDRGRLEEALMELRKATKLGAGADVYNNIGFIYYRFGEMEKATRAYKQALKMDPQFAPAHYGLGLLYLQTNSLDQALFEFEQVLRLKPDYAPVYYNLGMVYSRKGLKEKAIEAFELFLKYSPDEPQKEKVRTWMQQLRSKNP